MKKAGAIQWLFVVAVVVLLMAPMLLTKRAFGQDWTNHLWLVWQQGQAVSATGLPTFFVHTVEQGAFYPFFVFYGGTLYSSAGYLSALLGESPTVAYLAFYLLGFTMAYGGWLWLARQAGVASWRAHVPALVFVTGAFYLTNAYGRGDWPEFMATSAVPLLMASTVYLLRAERWQAAPTFAFVVATVIFSGSHNITLLWGSIFLGALGIAALMAGRCFSILATRRFAAIAALALLAVGINLWFLLPNLAYNDNVAFTSYAAVSKVKNETDFFNSLAVIFSPLRFTPSESSTPSLAVQIPSAVLLWAAAVIALTVRNSLALFWRRLLLGLIALLAGLFVFVLFDFPWSGPKLLAYIQFPFRLNIYVLVCVSLLVLIALQGSAQIRTARWRLMSNLGLWSALAFGGALALHQIWATPSTISNRDAIYAGPRFHVPKPNWRDPNIFAEASLGEVLAPPGRLVALGPGAIEGNSAELRLLAGSSLVQTNIASGPYIVKIEGPATVAGAGPDRRLVVRPTHGSRRGTLQVAVQDSWPFTLGRSASVGSLAAVTALLALLLGCSLRRRRAAGSR